MPGDVRDRVHSGQPADVFFDADLDAALATERRNVVAEIRDLLMADTLLTSNRLVSERIKQRLDELEGEDR